MAAIVTKKIKVKTSSMIQSLENTYNASAGGNGWHFGSGGFCNAGDVFTLNHQASQTAIQAGDNSLFLTITVDGIGVPYSHPKFTSHSPSGNSTAVISGSPVNLTRFEQTDDPNNTGLTAFGFSVRIRHTGDTKKYYFVPGPSQIVVVDSPDPVYVFQIGP